MASGNVSHAFVDQNDNGMRANIFDNNTWRSQVPYGLETGSLYGQDSDDEDCTYASKEHDDDEHQTAMII